MDLEEIGMVRDRVQLGIAYLMKTTLKFAMKMRNERIDQA